MDKYEYLFGKHLGYKPGAVEQVKFEYSPLSKGFNQFLKKDDKVNKDSKYSNDLRYDLCTILINIVCLVLMKYHQSTLNLIH